MGCAGSRAASRRSSRIPAAIPAPAATSSRATWCSKTRLTGPDRTTRTSRPPGPRAGTNAARPATVNRRAVRGPTCARACRAHRGAAGSRTASPRPSATTAPCPASSIPGRPSGSIESSRPSSASAHPSALFASGQTCGTPVRAGDSSDETAHAEPGLLPSAFVIGLVGHRLLDHAIRAQQQRGRDSSAKRLGGLEVDDQLKLNRLLNWKVTRLRASEYPIDVSWERRTRAAKLGPYAKSPPDWANSGNIDPGRQLFSKSKIRNPATYAVGSHLMSEVARVDLRGSADLKGWPHGHSDRVRSALVDPGPSLRSLRAG